jgi:hypothetical protein
MADQIINAEMVRSLHVDAYQMKLLLIVASLGLLLTPILIDNSAAICEPPGLCQTQFPLFHT